MWLPYVSFFPSLPLIEFRIFPLCSHVQRCLLDEDPLWLVNLRILGTRLHEFVPGVVIARRWTLSNFIFIFFTNCNIIHVRAKWSRVIVITQGWLLAPRSVNVVLISFSLSGGDLGVKSALWDPFVVWLVLARSRAVLGLALASLTEVLFVMHIGSKRLGCIVEVVRTVSLFGLKEFAT